MTSSITQSFYVIAKNGGYFRSEKQAGFLLSNCENNVYTTTANASFGFGDNGVVNNSYIITITCDKEGILSIVHTGYKTQSKKVFFQRVLTREQAEQNSALKQQRKQAFAECDIKSAIYNHQLLRLGKLKCSTLQGRLKIVELTMLVESKIENLHKFRNSI